ncbi:MAG: ABC transporter substrate-binding protein, partial [Betaproteobacteria bacterium]|nr:ABC transporter substrate-binding protein [Betaproteobacteria bacterium]
DLIDRLIAAGKALGDSRQDLFRSPVAIAVRKGAPRPDTGTGDALRAAILAARSIGYSTGPSGVELLKLFERWGIAGAVKNRAIQAPPGIPVGQMLAEGSVELGFQQLSEMMYVPGIELLGTMPQDCAIVSIFTAAQCCGSLQPDA